MEKRELTQGRLRRGAILLLFGVVAALTLNQIKFGNTFNFNYNTFQNFVTMFISIVLEAMPFILLGALVSALIQVFVSEDLISRFLPRNRFLGLLAASLMGIIFPVCECAIVPITRRLIKKGVPLSMAVTFMLSVPIVNPIVLMSTYYAFYDKPSMVLVRGGFGLIGAVVIGILISVLQEGRDPLKQEEGSGYHNSLCACGRDHGGFKHSSRFVEVIEHTNHELYDIGRYLIIGALLSSGFQTLVSRNLMAALGQHRIYSVAAMMALAYIISLCSEADAFIARSFLGQFTEGSIAAFLISGPMIDIKNTLMLAGIFKKSFVIKLIFLIFSVCFIIGFIVNALAAVGGIL
jgi:uncharacterized protein